MTPDTIAQVKKGINVGDRIKFRAVTRDGAKAVWRIVNGHWMDTGQPTVRFNGWGNFVVRFIEITEVERAS